jgi:hypothetical protein
MCFLGLRFEPSLATQSGEPPLSFIVSVTYRWGANRRSGFLQFQPVAIIRTKLEVTLLKCDMLGL